MNYSVRIFRDPDIGVITRRSDEGILSNTVNINFFILLFFTTPIFLYKLETIFPGFCYLVVILLKLF